MIKYVILMWNEEDLSDVRVLKNSSTNKARVFDIKELADIHAKMRTRNSEYRVVEIPILDD